MSLVNIKQYESILVMMI